MQSISSPYFEFPPQTLQDIRKKYELDKPGRMDESIDVLDAWIKKQTHFAIKDFNRDYLERFIINCKGSVEAAKKNMDSLCTYRSTLSYLYGDYDVKTYFRNLLELGYMVALPKFAPNYDRVVIIKCTIQEPNKEGFVKFYKYALMYCDHWKAHDYFNSFIVVLDYRHMNISAYLASFEFMELKSVVTMILEGYKARVKGIHILTSSTMINLIVTLLKQVISAKIGNRIHVHHNLEELFDVIPKDIMPLEYGGKERSLDALQDDWIDILGSKEHGEFMKEIRKAVTMESNRPKEERNNDSFGVLGTFRSLNVD